MPRLAGWIHKTYRPSPPFLLPAAHGDTVYEGMRVREVLFDGDQVTGVRVTDEAGTVSTIAATVVVGANCCRPHPLSASGDMGFNIRQRNVRHSLDYPVLKYSGDPAIRL